MVLSLNTHTPDFSSYKKQAILDWNSNLVNSFKFNHLFHGVTSKRSYWRLGLQIQTLGRGHNLVHDNVVMACV